ncbi:MAG TPA: DUF3530 family protein [Burkholderiales bacterium]|nr:DUF3530 family protein [Burkholderiales bacterium]
MKTLLMAATALFLSGLARAEADYVRERRWADEIVPAIVVGEPVYLEAAGHKFLALHVPRRNAAAGLVIVHGMGVHPDWGLIGPLRTGLADAGYATLSIQMPVLSADAEAERYNALFPEAAKRIESAIAFLRTGGVRKVAIVSHSIGARMANYFLANSTAPRVDAWVAIGIPGDYVQTETLRLPVLDIYGEGDFPALLSNAEKRADAIRALRGSAQVEVAGADHFFNGHESALVKYIQRFLDRALR